MKRKIPDSQSPARRGQLPQQRMVIRRGMAGFTYVEIIVATALIMISLVPALDALSVGTLGSGIHKDSTINHYYLSGKMEDLLALRYSVLADEARAKADPNTPTDFSDTVVVNPGLTLQRQVYLYGYDADNADGDNNFFTGTDPGLLWLKIEIEGRGSSLERLINVL